MQKGSVYAHIESKQDLLYETLRDGADAFHGALDLIPETLPAVDKLRLALRAHLAIVAEQLDVATVWTREWRYLEGERREEFVAARRRYEERIRGLFQEGVELSELRADLDVSAAALLFLSAANWAYTWLRPGRGHGRARRPLLRAARRRDARLLDARLAARSRRLRSLFLWEEGVGCGRPSSFALRARKNQGMRDSAEVVVIGGGAMGASVAWHLRELGIDDVVLLERDSLASGSTAKSAGGIRAQFADELNIRIALRSLDEFERMEGIDLRQHGYLFLLDDEADLERFQAALALQHSLGVPSRELSVDEALEIVPQLAPEGLLAATFCELDGYATPEAVVQWYAHGLDVQQGCAVTGIDVARRPRSSACETERGRIATGHRRLLRGRVVGGGGCDGRRRDPGRAASRAGCSSRRRTGACPSGCR